MERILEILGEMRKAGPELFRVGSPVPQPFAAVDPEHLRVELSAGAAAQLVVLHTKAGVARLDIALAEGAQFDLTEIFLGETFAEIALKQGARSCCRVTIVELSSANASYRIDLDGRGAANELNGVFLASGKEHCVVKLHTAHNVPDCTSSSCVKGVADDEALGEFSGLVYVAPDAQRTDARQQSRNVLLSEKAHIETMPQLEIYADDVKCSHGATVGQMDADAILYMRQRGLSETQARALQIEGFVGDIVRRCGVEPLGEALLALAAEKLER